MELPTLDGLIKEAGISLASLNQRCSSDHLNSISLFLDWRRVAPHLGLDKIDIDEIDIDKRTESEKRLNTLQKWKRKYGYMATYRSLVEVLLKVGDADHAERVCRLLKPQVHSGGSSSPGAATATTTPSDQPGGSPLSTKQFPSTSTATTFSDQSPGSPLVTTEPAKPLPSTATTPSDQPQDNPVTTAEDIEQSPNSTVEDNDGSMSPQQKSFPQSDSTTSTSPYDVCCRACCLVIRHGGVIVKLTATPEELMLRLPGLNPSIVKYVPLQTSYVLITCHHIIPVAAMSDLRKLQLQLDLGLGEEHIHWLELLVCGAVSCCGKDGIISSGPDPLDAMRRVFLPHQNSTSENPCYFKLDFTMLFLNKMFEENSRLSNIPVPELSLDIPKPSAPGTQLKLQLYQRVEQKTTVALLQLEVQLDLDTPSSPGQRLRDEIEMNKMFQRIHYTCTPGISKEASGSPVVYYDPVYNKAHLVGIHVGGVHNKGYYGVTVYEIIQLLKGKPAAFFALMAPELPLAHRMWPGRWAHLLSHTLKEYGRRPHEDRPSYSYLVEALHLLLRKLGGVRLINPRVADASDLIVKPSLQLLAALFKCFEGSRDVEIEAAISRVFAGDKKAEQEFRADLRHFLEFLVAYQSSAVINENTHLLNTYLECHNMMLNFKEKDTIAMLCRSDRMEHFKCLQDKYVFLKTDIARNFDDIFTKYHRIQKDENESEKEQFKSQLQKQKELYESKLEKQRQDLQKQYESQLHAQKQELQESQLRQLR